MLAEVWIGLSGHLRRLAVAGAMAAFAATAFAQSQMTAPKESDVPLDYAMDSKDKLAQQLNKTTRAFATRLWRNRCCLSR